jgi:hypothetical protein
MVEIPLWTAWVIMLILSIVGTSYLLTALHNTNGPDFLAHTAGFLLNAVVVIYVAVGVFA